MSELGQSYNDIMFSIPFNHLLASLAALEPEIKEKKENNILTIKEFKNGKLPFINL